MTKGITRELIVAAALELLDDQGIDGLTVRALATRLGVRAPALYWHVRNKQELLDEMATEVMRRVTAAFAAVQPGTGWRDDLTAYARVLRSEYLLHRDGARVFSGTRITEPDVVRMKEPLFERWTASGWKPADADDAVDVVTAFVVGFVIEEQERRQAAETDPTRYSTTQRDAWLGEGASLVKEAGHLQDDGDQRFERHLDIVLEGLAARLGS
ncbi:TetR/AcrR family transcriptional regulator C-terminal domain-containing protein [Promicromonospora iranensis]|jgi:AcrR family transcriptional regulator|uniref:TetR/AcrR family transcriptional regulator C-terminal domain-containing protein n=1 Tax=Promicromonospora iranensis TaxID=1105144 RepID=UPI0023A95C89|nr:TetR/AcrR family transcriptional regulator C-terminal domain-containing protein [Promicromonospora iranensis]